MNIIVIELPKEKKRSRKRGLAGPPSSFESPLHVCVRVCVCARASVKKQQRRNIINNKQRGEERERRRKKERGGQKKKLELLPRLSLLLLERERQSKLHLALELFRSTRGSFFFLFCFREHAKLLFSERARRPRRKERKRKRSREGGRATITAAAVFFFPFVSFIARRRRVFFLPLAPETRPALLSSNTLQRCRPLLRTTTMRRLVRWIWRWAEREKAKRKVERMFGKPMLMLAPKKKQRA